MSSASSLGDEERLEAILEQWFAQRHAGETPDLAVLCKDAPHLRPRVERLLERHAALLGSDDAGAPARGPVLVDQLGDYRLKARIGRGGMGEVFLARQESLGRLVALKVLRPELAVDPSRRLRFRREAEITAALDHPNIVPVYETGEQDGYVFIAMKLLDGQTLDAIPRPWDSRQLASVGAQVARALHAAHEVGVVHRDVKPANILLAERPYVLDFGLARARVDLSLTGEGQAPGTLSYMAPEQLQGGPAALDPRVDVYALGATLYHCLAGRPPFEEEQVEVLVRRVLAQDPEPLDRSGSERDLVTIVLRALDKEPARRFASALEMAEDLERFVGGYPIQSRRYGLTTRTVRLVRRHRLLSAAMAVTLLVVAALGAQLWDSRRWVAAERMRQIETAQGETQGKRFADALSTVERAQESFGHDPVLDELGSRALTTLQRDALLDQLQAGRRYQDVAHLQAIADDLEGGHPEVLAESHTALARMLLDFYQGRTEVVRRELGNPDIITDFPRCRAVLSAVLDSGSPEDALAHVDAPTPPTSSADDHVFASVVLRIAESPFNAIESELSLAWEIDPQNVRCRFGIALLRELRHELQGAEELLVGLLQDGIPRPEVRVLLARSYAKRLRFDFATKQLELAAKDLERNHRVPMLRLELAWLEVLLLKGDANAFTERLKQARRRWKDSALLSAYEGYQAYLEGDVDRARTAFEAAVANARMPWNKRRAQRMLLSLEVERCRREAASGLDTGDVLPGLLHRVRALREACRKEPLEESDVLVDLYLLYRLKGAEARAWRTLREAVAIEPTSERASYYFVWQVWEQFRPSLDSGLSDGDRERGFAAEALAEARRYYDRSQADASFTYGTKLAEVLTWATGLAVLLDNSDAAIWAGARARAAIAHDEKQQNLIGFLETYRQKLHLDAWPEVTR